MTQEVEEVNIGVVVLGGDVSQVKTATGTRPVESLKDIESATRFWGVPGNVNIAGLINHNLGNSTNRIPSDYKGTVEALHEAEQQFDATLVLAGLNTAAYDMAADTLARFGSRKHPVMFATALGSLGDEMARYGEASITVGIRGLAKAVERNLAEVMVVAANVGPRIDILRGSRATKASSLNPRNIFQSPTAEKLITVDFVDEEVYPNFFGNPYRLEVTSQRMETLPIRSDFDPAVYCINMQPGMYDPKRIMEHLTAGRYRALIIDSYQAGEVCDREPYNLVPVIKSARELGVPVLLNSQNIEWDSHFPPTGNGIDAGAIDISGTTHELALVKTMWLLGQPEFAAHHIHDLGPETLVRLFEEDFCTSFAGEVSYPRYYLPT